MRFDLAYACAWNYTRPGATPDAEAAPLGSLGNVRLELARGWPAPRLQWLADSKGLVFRLSSVCALQRTLRTLAASIERARTVIRPLHLRCPLQPPNPSCKGGYVDR